MKTPIRLPPYILSPSSYPAQCDSDRVPMRWVCLARFLNSTNCYPLFALRRAATTWFVLALERRILIQTLFSISGARYSDPYDRSLDAKPNAFLLLLLSLTASLGYIPGQLRRVIQYMCFFAAVSGVLFFPVRMRKKSAGVGSFPMSPSASNREKVATFGPSELARQPPMWERKGSLRWPGENVRPVQETASAQQHRSHFFEESGGFDESYSGSAECEPSQSQSEKPWFCSWHPQGHSDG